MNVLMEIRLFSTTPSKFLNGTFCRIISTSFMTKKHSSIDGFIPRRPDSQVGERHVLNATPSAPTRKELRSEDDLQKTALGTARPGRLMGRSDIDDSLNQIDEPDERHHERKMSRKERKRLKKESRTRGQKIRKRIIVTIILVIVAVLLAIGGFLAYKTFKATGSVLNGSFVDLIQNVPLKEDENGRSNFLILGTSEDDPGHEAGYLTDSIMVMSIDQDKKNAYMFSIPRDLYVNYGKACMSGYKVKINVYFNCVNDAETDEAEQERLTKTQEFIGGITGLDIQYGVHVNYTVMRDVINAIGGSVNVTIESRNPLGIMDSNFDWKCGKPAVRKQNCPLGHYIQYPNGPVTLDAEHALYLAQARGDRAPTYGFEQSNFDRERNQQMIAVAIKDKALSAGTLTNLGAVTGLIDALGNNLRTNIETKEIRTLMDVAQHIDNANIHSLDFYSDDNKLFTTGTLPGAGSSVYPAAGVGDYSDLRAYIKKELTADPFVKEGPVVTVLNGSGVAGIAQTAADALEDKGFTIDDIANAPEGSYGKVTIYQINKDKTASAAKLKEIYGVAPKAGTPPVSINGETDFVVIIGDATIVSGGQ
jgi:anionic cell wall polymer biosynthesis LytR-Cps2A-Psr (LCP) family protein